MQAQTQRSKILIVGSGFGGLGMAIRLKQQDIHDFKIIERAAEVGGTWRDNTYPGVACDVPSHLYSFSFIKNPNWSRVFPQGAEIQRYLIQCCDREDIRPHIDFHTQLEKARWNAEERIWEIQTSKGVYEAEFLITATGHLADEHLPQIPGLEEFQGQVMHSARWNHEVNLENQRVVVVGSGASAIQLVPEIAKTAKSLTVLQRSAPYILPRPDRPYSDSEKQLFRKDPDSMSDLRHTLFWGNEYNFAQRRNLKSQIERVKKNCLQFLKRQISDPELQRKLTPNYEPGCKRLLLSNDYYPTFLKPHVMLEDSALAQVTKDGVMSQAGHEFSADIIVFATGFEAARPPYAAKVVGKHGLSLEQQWSSGMQGYQSTTVHNFPNLFILNGPNTGSGHNSALYFLETQFDLILDALQFFEQEQIRIFEADQEAENSYMQELQQLSQGSVWLSESCKSWYLDPVSRKLTLVWPDYAHSFRDKNQHFIRSGYHYEYIENAQRKVI
ncbi:NAD(P)-binding protein [Acinetobacter sp. dk771]|uniref:NAD(P)-binding protein n=1 Tax=Acinetobacter wanghuae TaxID=2662362 RepID=A0AA90W409_9GAMM|nr:NAD(P)/FAD-dependent oxidoreductase [Acinetobacter wanghuae]MQW92067.1 NAD(P)-binding protein [Acinetobacter wanghuae]